MDNAAVRISELEDKLKLFEEMNDQLREQNTEVDKACARLEAIESAALWVVRAFEALGKERNAGMLLIERSNCETAMMALKAALLSK